MLWIVKKLAIWIIVAVLALSFGHQNINAKEEALHLVAGKLLTHSMNVQLKDLKASTNPSGEGVFVYAKKKDIRGIERKALWLVFEHEIFPLNSTAKELTPRLKWPEEVMPADWNLTGLNLYSFHKPMQWVFG